MRWIVDEAHAGRRLDAFLAAVGAAPSAAAARRAIEEDRVRVDGRRAKKGARVVPGQDVVVADRAAAPETPERLLEVLYEDADLIAVAKPAGVPSQSLSAGERGSMASAIVARFPECGRASADPREGGLGHRLDRDTTGVLLAARTSEAWQRLRAGLGSAACVKEYLAEVVGVFAPRETDVVRRAGHGWVIDAPIGRTGRRGRRVNVGGGRQPLEARTEIDVLEPRGETTLIEARLVKGRAHQVRAHLAHAGHPVVGDPVYGPETQPATSLRLHARAVTLSHPITGRSLRIEAPPPSWAKRRVT